MSEEFKFGEKNVDAKTKNLVFGFIRNVMELLPDSYNIPPLVMHICITFYYNPEYFDKIGHWIDISDDRLTVCNNNNFTNTVYGRFTIDCKNNNNVYKWSFIINKCYFIAIGIDESSAKWINTYFYGRTTKNYAFTSSGDKYTQKRMMPYKEKTHYGRNGTKIMMEFNLKNKSLSYYVNNETEPCSKIDDVYVKDDISYKLAVFLWGGGQISSISSITMTDFEIQS
eukprot:227882_1